jgi:phage tail-like protein
MPTGRTDPFLNYNFKLEIDGIQRAGFRECAGLDATTAVVSYREGNETVFTSRKLPGQVTYSNISLKWGITDDHSLWDWAKKFVDGKGQLSERKNGSIVLMDESGQQEKKRWNFVFGWPTKWTGPSFNATANDVAIESLDIAHEGLALAS